MLFYLLEWPHAPYAVGFIPKYEANDESETNYEEVISGDTVNH